MRSNRRLRQGALPMVALLGVVLAGCASLPSERPMALSGAEPAVTFNTGRVTVVVTDFGGQPLQKAVVDIESTDSSNYFRTAAFSDMWGRVSFAGVPGQVRINVYHAESRGSYSREFLVPSSGTTELRMMIEPHMF